MGTTCSCVEPCEKKPSCLSNLKYKLQYTAENRRLNRQCPCTNRRPKCLKRRRKRKNPFCDCEETGLPHHKSHVTYDRECPVHPNQQPPPPVQTPPPQQKTILRYRSRSASPATPQINVYPFPQQTQNFRPAATGHQARPPTPATKEAGTYTNIEETPPSEPPTPRLSRCPRSKPPTPICPRKTICTCTNRESTPVSDMRSKSKTSSPEFSKKSYTSTVETETTPYEPPAPFMQKTCLRSKQHLPVCPRRMVMNTKPAFQTQRSDKSTMRTRSPESRSPSPPCNKETCPFMTGFQSSSPTPDNVKKVCICANSVQGDDSSNSFIEDLKNVRRFTIDAYFV
ncbi:uncharacterized protein LOC128680942 [Plodia interpunctella]|uniref:uncharacterized protein LOC128680942 n=1 Tax=Plodia interpunctella TaxID=58824 RepID=UPI002367F181|nr:uncharacterized protein LOC128680942 [Plodia interpunctella]